MNRAFFAIFTTAFLCVSAVCSAASLAEKIALARHLADEAAAGKAPEGRVLTNDFDFDAELRKFRASAKFRYSEVAPEDSDITELSPAGKPQSEDSAMPEAPRRPPFETASKSAGNAEKPQPPAKKTSDKPVVDTTKNFVNGYYVPRLGDDEKTAEKAVDERKKLAELAAAAPRVYSYETRLFSIVSDDYNAHSTATGTIAKFERAALEYIGGAKGDFPLRRKILVQIFTDKSLEIASGYKMSFSPDGGATITFKFAKDLPLETYCRATAECLLAKIAYERGGESAARNVPLWLKSAFATAFERSVRFGVARDTAAVAAENPPPLPAEVFATTALSPEKSAAAYWTLAAVAKASKDKNALARFVGAALAGETPEKLSKRIEALKPQNFDFATWWRCLVSGEIYARLGGVYSPRRSADEIARLAVLQVDTTDGGRTGVPFEKLFDLREDYSETVKLRLLEIKVAFSNINPLYHNALVELGRLYEAVSDGDAEAFGESKKRFLDEFKNARNKSEIVKSMMEK